MSDDTGTPISWRVLLGLTTLGWTIIGTWLLIAESVPRGVVGVDPSVGHLVIFLGLTFTFVAWPVVRGTKRLLAAAALIALLAAGSELVQQRWTASRTASLQDWLWDLVGIALAVALAAVLRRALRSVAVVRIAAVVSLVGLTAVGANLVADHPSVVQAWTCRDAASPAPSDADSPVLLFSATPRSADARQAICRTSASGQMLLVVTFVSDNISQDGPTRLVSSSSGLDDYQVNFHVAQTGPHLSIRIGRGASLGFDELIVEDVVVPGRQQTAVVRLDRAEVEVSVDGQVVGSLQLDGAAPTDWDPTLPITVGDENGGGRQFEGSIVQVGLYDRMPTTLELPGG